MRGINLHDVPDDRLAADLDHGLGLEVRLFADSGAESPGKDDRLHSTLRSLDPRDSRVLDSLIGCILALGQTS